MIARDQAWQLLTAKLANQNLRRHCLSVEAVMRALAKHFQADTEKWGLVGLLHDGDYEVSKDQPQKHTLLMVEWLKEIDENDPEIISAILSHNFAHTAQNPPQNQLEWSLNCCDELTGLIVAVTLVQPSKKLIDVTVESIMKKWSQKAFAAGVHREQIAACEERLGIPVRDFVTLSLVAMQGIASEIGL
ncbi:MAG: HDIG domain-containing protein [bacterium]|nr:HDIG domain-containing protein [bacterium]